MRSCYVCGTTQDIHSHHVYGGKNRKLSEKHGMKVDLCGRHHNLSNDGVHFNTELDLKLKRLFQAKFEDEKGAGTFIKIFGRNYF